MKPINRSYTTAIRRKHRKNSSQKPSDLLEKPKTKKSSIEKLSGRSFLKRQKKKKDGAPIENYSGTNSKEGTTLIIKNKNINPTPALDLSNIRFIVLDNLDEDKDCEKKIKRTICRIKSNSKNISTRKKSRVIKRSTISQALTASGIPTVKKKKTNKEGFLSKTHEITFFRGKLRARNSTKICQQAAGDSEKKEKNFQKNIKEDKSDRKQSEKSLVQSHKMSTMNIYENISNMFLDICLPFTFARQKSVEDDISKIDGKFIKSLMKIAKSRELLKNKKVKIPKSKSKHNKIEGDSESVFVQNLPQRSSSERKSKKLKEKPKKRLHQTQNVLFIPQNKNEYREENSTFCELKMIKNEDQPFIITKLQDSKIRNAVLESNQGPQTKCKKFRSKMTTQQNDRNQKSRSVNSKLQEINASDTSLNENGSNITEIWRNKSRVESDNSLSIHSTSSTDNRKETDYSADFEMKSYKTLIKIVGEEVQRICKHRQKSDEKTENEIEISVMNDNLEVDNAVEEKKKESKSLKSNSNQKLAICTQKSLSKMFCEEKHQEDTPLSNETVSKEKQDKLNELKTKLNFLAAETHDNGKIQSEIVKNWSVIRRLEKAFLALGTPGFPNKNSKNATGAIFHANSRDSDRRKICSPDKILRARMKSNHNCEEFQAKSQIPVLASSKYDTPNRHGCEQNQKTDRSFEASKKIVRPEDFDKPEIYFFSFEPTGRRKSSAKAWLEGLDKKKFEKITISDNDTFGKYNISAISKKKATEGEKEIQASGQWPKSANESEKSWLKPPQAKPRHQNLETKLEKKSGNRAFEKHHSTHTILPPLTKTDSKFFLNGSSSRTYILDSEQEDIDCSATLERKKTFAVISAKNFAEIKPTVKTKPCLYNTSQQRAAEKSLQSPKTINQTRKTEEHYKKIEKSNLEFVRKNYLKMKRNKRKRYEGSGKILIPWDDSIDDVRNSKTSILMSRKSEEKTPTRQAISLRYQNKVLDTKSRTPGDSQIEPLTILMHRNLEPKSSFRNRVYDSSISTETYNISDGNNQIGSRSMGFPEMQTIASVISKGAQGAQDRHNVKKNTERCRWEDDIKQYREIVKDIMSQYQRTNDFLKQSHQMSKFRRERDPENDSEVDTRDRHFVGQVSNIAEYRKKIMSEYKAMPLIDYKSRFLREDSGRSTKKGEFLGTRNLFVAKNVTEDVDFDVKDYQPNVHKILDSQMYVDVKKIGRRVKANGKHVMKAVSFQAFARNDRGCERPPEIKYDDKMNESETSRKLENEILPMNSSLQREPEKENPEIEWIAIKPLNSSSNENNQSGAFACLKQG